MMRVTVIRKNYGVAEDYPGLFGVAEVLCETGDECVVSPDGVQQRISVTNSSLLTYEVHYKSTCHKDFLHYPGSTSADDNVWEGTFAAPFRWNGRARTSSVHAKLAAHRGREPAVDRETRVSLDYQPANYARVGPFEILLQVNSDGS
jgi:hypothetical protein